MAPIEEIEVKRDEFPLTRVSYDLELEWEKKNYIFISIILYLKCIILFNYEGRHLCFCHQQKSVIFISYYGCCDILKYCLITSSKAEVIRSITRSWYSIKKKIHTLLYLKSVFKIF